MKTTRMFILVGIFLLSLGLVSGALATASATREVIDSPEGVGEVDETFPQFAPANGDPAYDLGDAPDSTNHFNDTPMTAYGGSFPTQGSFPTVFDPSLTPPPGPRHAQPLADAWLGMTVTLEYEADQLPDYDGVTNIDPSNDLSDRDEGDDGVLPGSMNLNNCAPSDFWVEVNIVGGPATRYLNTWFDWNLDGNWDGWLICPGGVKVYEWAVQNYTITLGNGKHFIPVPAFIAGRTLNPDSQWMRVTLSRQPAPLNPGTGTPDGRGPEAGYEFGETEDYNLEYRGPPPVGWEKWVNDVHWPEGMSVSVETSDTIKVVDVINTNEFLDVELVEKWDPFHLRLIDVVPEGGQVITGTGVLTWYLPEGGEVMTLTKFFHVEPCEWEYTILEEVIDEPDFLPMSRPVIINKIPAELHIDSVYNTEAYAGGISNFTLVYSNTGGYENGVWIHNIFPPEALFLSSTPAPDHVAADGSEAIWLLGDLATGFTGSIDVQVAVTDSLEVSSTIEIWDGIFNHAETLADETVIKLHVEEYPEHDIYIKDNTSDDGSVPSISPYWVSPDIWVRHSKDGGLSHQNPVPGGTNFVYVRVRNRMATTVSDIKVDVYWTSAALGTSWPAGWGHIGFFLIPSLAPGAEYTGWVQWDTPAIAGHFCLRVRADSPDDPIGSGPDTVVPVDAVKNNNNIAMKNVNILDFPEIKDCGYFSTTVYSETVYMDVINIKNTAASVDIILNSDDGSLASGEIILDPGDLWGRWNALESFDQVGMTLEPTGFPARISDVLMMPGETVRMTMTIAAEVDEKFTIDIVEQVNEKIVGGIRYVRVLPDCALMPLISYTPPPTTAVSAAFLPSSDSFGWKNTDP